MKLLLHFIFASLLLATLAACSKQPDHDHAAAPTVAARKHEHRAPHGGTAIVLGVEIYHLELVLDAPAGKLTAYVLDGEMENFIRVKTASFEIVATVGGERRPLTFRAAVNPATGETDGDTSQFEAQADWLKTTPAFDAVLSTLTIKGTAFTAVAFNYPKGNDKN